MVRAIQGGKINGIIQRLAVFETSSEIRVVNPSHSKKDAFDFTVWIRCEGEVIQSD